MIESLVQKTADSLERIPTLPRFSRRESHSLSWCGHVKCADGEMTKE
jgi:hypothetical protein